MRNSSDYVQIPSLIILLKTLCISCYYYLPFACETPEVDRNLLICPRLYVLSKRGGIPIQAVWLPTLCC